MASILVTGASSGIGLACVSRFHANGDSLLVTVRKASDAAMLRSRFAGIDVLELDLTVEQAVQRIVGGAIDRRGGVDVVVANAGASIVAAAEELALADYRAQLDLNLLAAIQVTQLALPAMRARGGGRIVLVSSGFGRTALPMFSAYCASKYALEGFGEALALEVAPLGIGVTLIEPGPVRTRFDANRREGLGYREDGPYGPLYSAMRARLASSHQRGPSTAEEVAAVILRAATEPRPALRYPVGPMGLAAALVARFVPDRLKLAAAGSFAGGPKPARRRRG